MLGAALDGDSGARALLFAELKCVVDARVRTALRRWGSSGRDFGAEAADLAQEIFLYLLEHEQRVLRTWDAQRGLSLRGFVGLVAQRRASALLRTQRRCAAQLTEPHRIDELEHETSLEAHVLAESTLFALMRGLSPRHRALFARVCLSEDSVEQVAEQTGLSVQGVYSARLRLRARAREAVRSMERACA